jgi:hypothetical protein
MAVSGRFFLNLGGTIANLGAIRWGFRAPAKAYDNIAGGLGVTKVDDANRTGISYGINQPRPARVRIAYSITGNKVGNAIRFCEPDSLNDVLFGSLNALQVVVSGSPFDIDNVTIK